MFYNQTFDEIRAVCKNHIESLELWLRRIITEQLGGTYGNNFLTHQLTDNRYLISKKISEPIFEQYNKDPSRYPRIIDAALLDHCNSVITNPNLYEEFFSIPFSALWPDNLPHKYEYLRHILSLLVPIRNKLYHANPISLREAERVVFYTNEIIQALSEYYSNMGKEREYNVPSIIRITDSLGHEYHKKYPNRVEEVNFTNERNSVLHVGDILRIEIFVDPSFKDSKILYRFGGPGDFFKESNELVYEIQERDIGPTMVVYCQIKADRNWTYLSSRDDEVALVYKVSERRK